MNKLNYAFLNLINYSVNFSYMNISIDDLINDFKFYEVDFKTIKL